MPIFLNLKTFLEDTFMEETPCDIFADFAVNNLSEPKIIRGRNGKIAFGTDIGVLYPKPENEDAVVIRTEENAFAVIDGIGGLWGGRLAAQILGKQILLGFTKRLSFEEIQKLASQEMGEAGIRDGGACYIGAQITEGSFTVHQAGDVKLIIINKHCEISFETQDEGYGAEIFNAVQGINSGRTRIYQHAIWEGDRIIAASDGLWDNISPSKAEALIRGETIGEAIRTLSDEAKQKMQSGGKPDNISIVIYDIEHL